MESVVALVADVQQRARLQVALHGRAAVVFSSSEAEFLNMVMAVQPAAVIVTLRNTQGRSHVPVISVLRARFAALPIFAYCRLDHDDVQELVRAARAGIDEVLLDGANDEWIVLGAIPGSSESERVARAVLREVDHVIPHSAKAVFRYSLIHTRPRAKVNEIALALGIHRKTLVERLERAGLPHPSEIISWSRLLCAAYLLDAPDCSVESAAHRSGFDSAAALRGMLRRYVGLRPKQLRERGAFEYLVGRFEAALHAPIPIGTRPRVPVGPLAEVRTLPEHGTRCSGTSEGWNVA